MRCVQLLIYISLSLCLFTGSCISGIPKNKEAQAENNLSLQPAPFDTTQKTIHVFVALCDNKYQGIVPVPASIGNGQDPDNNLYWGIEFGIRTFFKRSKEWKLERIQPIDSVRMERLVFKHVSKNYFLIADAYNGKFIKTCTKDFIRSSSGDWKDTLHVNKKVIGINGNAKMLAYIGHDGLMDFNINESFINTDHKKRDVIILACISRKYFAPHLQTANVNPLLVTTGLMCPEAYTLHDALIGYINNESVKQISERAAKAYSKFQRCSITASRNLLVSGW